MATLRFISDSAHGWLEVPTVDVAAAGVTPSRYSYIDATTGMTYLDEDCDATAYIAHAKRAIAAYHRAIDTTVSGAKIAMQVGKALVFKDVYIDGECWVRDLPRCGPECSWCGRTICPDRHRPQGCWFQNCPDDPHYDYGT